MEGVCTGSLSFLRQSEQQELPEVSRLLTHTDSGIHGGHNPSWATEDLRRNRLHDEEFCVWKDRGEYPASTLHLELQNRTSLLESIKACGKCKDLQTGSRLHASIIEKGLLKKDIALSNALLSMYAKCGAFAKAQELFNLLASRNIVTWNALISAYAQHERGAEALSCFGCILDQGLSPNAVTFASVLKACSSMGAIDKGEEIHAEVNRLGLLGNDIVLGTALVDMYANCGALEKAQGVFDELPARDVASWNALIAGYAQHGLGHEALFVFGKMENEGFLPNAVTFVCILKACGSIGAVEKGKEIHAEVSRQGLLEKNNVVGNALVDMYAKCGALAKAQGVFDKLPVRDLVAWNALITGYTQHEFGDEALSCFTRMQEENLSPDSVTLSCILKACGSIGAAEKGEEIRAEVRRRRLSEEDIVLGTALVDMYAKCGAIAKAQGVFEKLPARSVVSWNTLLAGYAQVGEVKMVSELFDKMIGEGIKPGIITFIVLLTACSHAGLVEEGQKYFDTMSSIYHIIPTLKHRTCMVDIFSRAGLFDRAISVIEKLPPSQCLEPWSVLMGACGRCVNVELGRWAFEHAMRLDDMFGSSYVCIQAAGMQDEADEYE